MSKILAVLFAAFSVIALVAMIGIAKPRHEPPRMYEAWRSGVPMMVPSLTPLPGVDALPPMIEPEGLEIPEPSTARVGKAVPIRR